MGCERHHSGDPSAGVQHPSIEISWTKTVLTFQPSLLSSRAALVAGIGAALALSALASLSPAPPRASMAEMPPFHAPKAASIAYSYDPLLISRADSFIR